MKRVSLLVILLLCPLSPVACASNDAHGCPGSVKASLTGVIAVGAAGTKRGVALPPESRAVITLGGGTLTWKSQNSATVIDNKKASGELPAPVTTTTSPATTTTTNISFGPTTVPVTVPPRAAPAPDGRLFTAATTFANLALTVKGTIVGPPAPCHGIGNWSLTSPGNSQAGGGSWSF